MKITPRAAPEGARSPHSLNAGWTEQREAVLRQRWERGDSAADIAAYFGGDYSPRAIIGKAHRMGLERRAEVKAAMERLSQRAKAVKGSKIARTGVALTPPRPIAHEPLGARKVVPLEQLRPGRCKWPFGDPRRDEFGFCGEKAVEGKPYCETHVRRAYDRETPRMKPRDLRRYF